MENLGLTFGSPSAEAQSQAGYPGGQARTDGSPFAGLPFLQQPAVKPRARKHPQIIGKERFSGDERTRIQSCLVSDDPGQSGRNDPAKPNRLRQGDFADGPGRLHQARGVPECWQTFRPTSLSRGKGRSSNLFYPEGSLVGASTVGGETQAVDRSPGAFGVPDAFGAFETLPRVKVQVRHADA